MIGRTVLRDDFIALITGGDVPPWRSVPTRTVAAMLGVSLQVMANWRVRNDGPPTTVRRKGAGHKTFYRLDDAAVWASDGVLVPWEINRDWLNGRGLAVHGESSEASTAWLIASADSLL